MNFFFPAGVTSTSNGTVYVADTGNMIVRMVTGSGVSTPIGTAGVSGSADGTNQTAQFSQFLDICVDKSGNLYIPDTGNDTIRKATLIGTNWVVTTIAGVVNFAGAADGTNGAGHYCQPSGFTIDQSGNMYVSDCFNNLIRKLSLSGTNWVTTTIAGTPGSVGSADGMGSAARYFSPEGIALDTHGNVYVADTGNSTIRMINAVGVSKTLAGTPDVLGSSDGTNGNALFNGPIGIAADAATNIYVVDYRNNTLRKISPVGTNWVVTTIAGSPGQSGTNDGTNSNARFYFPAGLGIDATTNLYVADSGNQKIRKVSRSGTNWVVTTTSMSGTGFFFYPSGIAIDAQGNVYVSDQETLSVFKFSPNGTNWTSTHIAGGGTFGGNADGTNYAAQFAYNLSGLAVDKNGNVYVADTANCTIRRISPSGTNYVVTTLGGVGLPTFRGHGIGTVGTNDGTAAAARFFFPTAVAVDASGNVYVADTHNNTIRKGAPPPIFIVLGKPSLSANQVQFAFSLTSGSAASFHLLQASQATGPWTTNYSATIVTNVPGASYTVTVPAPGNSAFFCIQTP